MPSVPDRCADDLVDGGSVEDCSHVDLRLRVEDRLEVAVEGEASADMSGKDAQRPACSHPFARLPTRQQAGLDSLQMTYAY